MNTKQKSIEEVRAKHEAELMRLPNVTAVAIGKQHGREVITVFVTRKVPTSALAVAERIPSTIDGFATAVEESGEISATNS